MVFKGIWILNKCFVTNNTINNIESINNTKKKKVKKKKIEGSKLILKRLILILYERKNYSLKFKNKPYFDDIYIYKKN